MKNNISLTISFLLALLLFPTCLLGGKKIDDLTGTWILKEYPNFVKEGIPTTSHQVNKIKIDKKGKLEFWFIHKNDSVGFSGRIKFMKDGTIQVKNSIREIIHLGQLEECVSASFRIDFKGILFSINSYVIANDNLIFRYSSPNNKHSTGEIIFIKEN